MLRERVQEWMAEKWAQGHAEGQAEGQVQGRMDLMRRQAARKFGDETAHAGHGGRRAPRRDGARARRPSRRREPGAGRGCGPYHAFCFMMYC